MTPPAPVAPRLARTLAPLIDGDLPVRLRAWDGSEAGPPEAPLVELRSPDAVRRMLRHPGELGAAQAYVTGELEVHGDLDEALDQVFEVARERGLRRLRPSPAALVGVARAAGGLGLWGPVPAPPTTQARVRGRMHTRRRDRAAIAHHYDLSNDFYALILDESMAYSCGYWTSDDPGYGLAEAQRDKLALVCRKLGLEEGMTLLDVGCGWGSLSLFAAEHVGARVRGVTIAAEQKRFIDARIAERGLGDRVRIDLCDYRDVRVPDGGYDAVASIEMGEHVGERTYPTYVEALRRAVRPGGSVLIQQMSRPGRRGGRHPGGGPFIESFIAPDMHMRPVGETVAHLEHGGLEVRDLHALREHYVRTVAAWQARLESHQDRLRDLVGEEMLRVWRLYLVGGSMAFRDGRMGVDQILAVRPGARHRVPAVRDW